MSARDRARLLHWNIDPAPRDERDPAGEIVAQEIRRWNEEAARAYAAWRKLAEELNLTK